MHRIISEKPPIISFHPSIIDSSKTKRIDPLYYQYLLLDRPNLIKHLEKQGLQFDNVDDVIDIESGNKEPNPSQIYLGLDDLDSNSGIINNYQSVEEHGISGNSKKFHPNNVLYAKLRPYLNKTTIVPRFIKEGCCSTDFYVIKPKIDIQLEYIKTYLTTKFTVNASTKMMSGSGLPRVAKPDFIIIPFVSVEKNNRNSISQIIRTSYYMNILAESLGKWIPEFTMDYLGIEMPEESDELCFTVQPKEVNKDSLFRLDCEYYRPFYRRIIEDIKRNKTLSLSKFSEICSQPKKVKILDGYSKGIIGILRENINNKTNMLENMKLLKGNEILPTFSKKIEKNDILLSFRSNSLGTYAIFNEDKDNVFASHDSLIQLRCNEEKLRIYLLALLKTDYITNQMKRKMRGFDSPRCYPSDFDTIEIPIPDKDSQILLGNFYRTSIKSPIHLYSISKSLLSIGTTLLEKLIEADSDEERSHITTLLQEIVDSIHAYISIDLHASGTKCDSSYHTSNFRYKI